MKRFQYNSSFFTVNCPLSTINFTVHYQLSTIHGFPHTLHWAHTRASSRNGIHANTFFFRAQESEEISTQMISKSDPRRALWESPTSTSWLSIRTERYGLRRKMMWLYYLRWTHWVTSSWSDISRAQERECDTHLQWEIYQRNPREEKNPILRISDR